MQVTNKLSSPKKNVKHHKCINKTAYLSLICSDLISIRGWGGSTSLGLVRIPGLPPIMFPSLFFNTISGSVHVNCTIIRLTNTGIE